MPSPMDAAWPLPAKAPPAMLARGSAQDGMATGSAGWGSRSFGASPDVVGEPPRYPAAVDPFHPPPPSPPRPAASTTGTQTRAVRIMDHDEVDDGPEIEYLVRDVGVQGNQVHAQAECVCEQAEQKPNGPDLRWLA